MLPATKVEWNSTLMASTISSKHIDSSLDEHPTIP